MSFIDSFGLFINNKQDSSLPIINNMNIKKILTGAFFLGIAAFIIYSANVIYKPIVDTSDFASLTHATRVYKEDSASTPQETQTTSPTERILEPRTEIVSKESEPLRLKAIVKEAETKYDQEDIQDKEGQMWIDRASSQYLVTLGALHGLQPEQRLAVYYNEKRVGQVAVQTTFDVISYVKPLSGTNLSEDNYYTVIVEP